MTNKISLCLYLSFIIITCLFQNSSQLSSEELYLTIIKTSDEKRLIVSSRICIGTTSEQCFNMQLDFQTFNTWVINSSSNSPHKNHFDIKKSPTFKIIQDKISIYYMGLQLTGLKGEDKIRFGVASKDNDIAFTVVNYSSAIPEEVDGVIGLGYLTRDDNEKQSSLITQLLSQKKIDYDVFSIDFVDDFKATLHIGDFPSIILYDYQFYGTCDLIYNTPTWECSSKETVLDKKETIELNYKVLFLPTHKIISPPNDLKDSIWRMLSRYSSLCSRDMEEETDAETFRCKFMQDIYPSIIIKFSYWKLTIPIKALMKQEESILFTFHPNNNDWILGYDYLRYFTLVFDKHNEKMGFYNQEWVSYIGNDNLQKPTLSNNMGSSLIPKNKNIEVKSTDPTVSFVFNLFMFITFLIVILVVIALIYDYLKKANNNDNVISFYSKSINELFDSNSRSSRE